MSIWLLFGLKHERVRGLCKLRTLHEIWKNLLETIHSIQCLKWLLDKEIGSICFVINWESHTNALLIYWGNWVRLLFRACQRWNGLQHCIRYPIQSRIELYLVFYWFFWLRSLHHLIHIWNWTAINDHDYFKIHSKRFKPLTWTRLQTYSIFLT